MSQEQKGTWIFCLIMGLIIAATLPQLDFYLLLVILLIAYPVFCLTVNKVSAKIKEKLKKE